METINNNEIYANYVSTQLSFMGHRRNLEKSSQELINLFGRFIPKNKEKRFLDIGCGMGEFLYALRKKKYFNIQGIDISKECVMHCKKIGFSNIKNTSLISFLKNKRSEYDVMSLIDVLEHICKEDLLLSAELIYEHLASGGRVLIRVPNMEAPFAALRGRYCDLTHISGFTTASLNQLLRLAGFTKIHFFNQETSTLQNRLKRIFLKLSVKILINFIYYAYSFHYPDIDTENIICVAYK